MKGIKYIAPRGTSGYAIAAKTYMLALNKIVPVTWKQLTFDKIDPVVEKSDWEVNSLVNRDIEVDTLLIHSTPEHWDRLIDEETQQFKKIIGQTVWETTAIHPLWVKYCNSPKLSEVWVPTEWNKKVFIDCGVTTPIKVVPHLYEKEESRDCNIHGIDSDDLVFYTIGQWTERKGISDTLKAFCEAFTSNDKVCLTIKAFGNNYEEGEKQRCRELLNDIIGQYVDYPKVIFIPDECSKEQIQALHNKANVYISLCKAEGWGLGAFEAASVGTHVITTNFGGSPAFLPLHYSLSVDYDLVTVEGMSHIPWYLKDQKWAQPDVKDAVKKLRYCYERKAFYLKKDLKLKKFVINNFSPKAVLTKRLLS